MSDEVEAISEVSSSSSSSSSQETHESSSTQSTSETSSSSSSSSTTPAEETHEINTNDSTSISHEAHEADEADGSSVNMNWLSKDEAIEQANKRDETAKADDGNSVNLNWLNQEEAIERSAKLQEAREPIQEANKTVGEIAVDYARQFEGEVTCFINKDGERIPSLTRQATGTDDPNYIGTKDDYGYKTNNCANFASAVLVETGLIDEHQIGCSVFKDYLMNEEGYKEVSIEEAQAGDVWIHLNKDGTGHTELVSGRDEDGNLTFIGSNNIFENGNNTHIQSVSEHSKTDNEVIASKRDVILHKDFTSSELKNIAETLDNNAIYDISAEKAAEKASEVVVPGEVSNVYRDTMSDISALKGEIETITNILDVKKSEPVDQASDLAISEQNFATAPVEQSSESSSTTTNDKILVEKSEAFEKAQETAESKGVVDTAIESLKGLIDKIFG